MLWIVVATSENGVIGRGNALPWRLRDDLRHFKRLTSGHTVVMGRRTYESMGRALPDRRNVVLTRREGWSAEGVEVARSLDEALRRAAGGDDVFVIGGAEVIREALPRADRLSLTRVHADVEGDTFLPEIDWSEWDLVEAWEQPAGDGNDFAFTVQTYRRVR